MPASAFVSQVNRATSETLRLQATQEGLAPLKAWIKSALDQVVQVYLDAPDLEFVWVGDDAVDPLQHAQTLNILVGAGIKTIAEARAELGLAAEPKTTVPKPAPKASTSFGKFNPNHDERGRFTTADGAATQEAQRIAHLEGWRTCHEKCLADTEGVWPSSDRLALYRLCVRGCLSTPAGDDY